MSRSSFRNRSELVKREQAMNNQKSARVIRALSRRGLRSAASIAVFYALTLVSSFPLPLPAFQEAALSSSPPVIERGRFLLHKWGRLIGAENYEVQRDGGALIIKAKLEAEDRVVKVPLAASLRTGLDLRPEKFELEGKTSRHSDIKSSVEIEKATAVICEGARVRREPASDRFFTIDGYAPATIQMMLVRYALNHKIKGKLKTLPAGDVEIEFRGRDRVEIGGKQIDLQRYGISGITWGGETLWFDDSNQLIAVITVDAEFDHFEAIREGYESALTYFIVLAAREGILRLSKLAAQGNQDRQAPLAIVGATLIDGTGRPPTVDSVVVVKGDRIISVGPGSTARIPAGSKIVGARGMTLLPGLWDMHAHFQQVEWGPVYLAAGVTTARDVGNELEFITTVRDAVKSGRMVGPSLILAGLIDGDSSRSLGVAIAKNAEEARALVKRYKDAGYEQIKIYGSLKPELVAVI